MFLSLGRVDPAPHTEHLLGPFAAIAQNSSLRSFSIVDSLANRQHSCRGSEELATKQLRATPSYSEWGAPKNSEPLRAAPSHSELLRVRGAQELRATPSHFKLLRATPSYSEPLQATPSYCELLRATPSYSELLRVGGAQELRATQSCSQKLRAASPEPAVSRIASSSEPLQLCCLLARDSTIEKLQSEEF